MNKIKKIRLQLGFKQFKIAEKLEMSTRHYARLENSERKPNDEELNKISEIFGCEITDLKD